MEETTCYKILLVDDDEDEYIITRDLLNEIAELEFELEWISSFDKALEVIYREVHDVFLFDYRLGVQTGLELLHRAMQADCSVPIILLTGQGDHDIDMQAMKAGAADYLVKDKLDASLLERSIRYAVERQQAKEQIMSMAYYDSLTGLPNRLLFSDRLEIALSHARRYKRILAVFFIDVDNFKTINDTLGHRIGDFLLEGVSVRIDSCLRKSDTIGRAPSKREKDTLARQGGDEFTVLLNEINEIADAARVAQRMQTAMVKPFILEEHEVYATISIGIAMFPQDGNDTETLMKSADTAMYHAKDRGKNNWQFFKQEMNDIVFQRLLLERDLRRAEDKEEFLLYYQPILDLVDGRIIGVEALLRWQHPEQGLLTPDKFLSVIEETGRIIPIGEWVLKQACQDVLGWKNKEGTALRLAVNLSSRQFTEQGFIETVKRILSETGFSPELLELEITESIMMHDVEQTISIMKDLRAIGISFSLDDFGTGYSSLMYLKRFPLDAIKIDRSFVRDVMKDSNDAAITKIIIDMANELTLRVIAEGAEAEDQLNFLLENGSDAMQGYLLSPPISAEGISQMLQSETSELILCRNLIADYQKRRKEAEVRSVANRLRKSAGIRQAKAARAGITILLADDDEDDRFMAREALEEAKLVNALYTVEDGEELLDYLHQRGKYADPTDAPRPGLILLDLNMPKVDGRQALEEIKADPDLRRIPIVVLTTSMAEEDILRSYDLGVNSFITKPVTFEGLVSVMQALTQYWFQIVELPSTEN